jgi:DNA-binding winged helix-turn-helix (wHTH) protein
MATLTFGPFRLDPHALELRRDGRRIRIRPQPCRVLALLASRPGELVTRQELRAALWPDGVFVRFDLGLNSCLKQIRAALGESADAPRYVETLSRRGYRFTGDVIAEEPGGHWMVRFIPLNSVDAH